MDTALDPQVLGVAGVVVGIVVFVVLWKILKVALKLALFLVVCAVLAFGVGSYVKYGRVALPMPTLPRH